MIEGELIVLTKKIEICKIWRWKDEVDKLRIGQVRVKLIWLDYV